MTEITCICETQITQILSVPDDGVPTYEQLSDDEKRKQEADLKTWLNADKVDITGYKAFIHEPKPDTKQPN